MTRILFVNADGWCPAEPRRSWTSENFSCSRIPTSIFINSSSPTDKETKKLPPSPSPWVIAIRFHSPILSWWLADIPFSPDIRVALEPVLVRTTRQYSLPFASILVWTLTQDVFSSNTSGLRSKVTFQQLPRVGKEATVPNSAWATCRSSVSRKMSLPQPGNVRNSTSAISTF